jgi:hypothetical protein
MGTRWLPARPFSAIPLYPWFQLVFSWRHWHYVVAGGGVIRGSLISVILAGFPLTSWKLRHSRSRVIRHSVLSLILVGVRVTSRILRSTGRRAHPPQRYISHSSSCFCGLQEITSLQTTVVRPYSKCVALSVMRTIRFSTYFVGSTCRFLRSWWLPAAHCPATALYSWCGTFGVTSRAWCALCVMHRKRGKVSGMPVCEHGNLKRREGSK